MMSATFYVTMSVTVHTLLSAIGLEALLRINHDLVVVVCFFLSFVAKIRKIIIIPQNHTFSLRNVFLI